MFFVIFASLFIGFVASLRQIVVLGNLKFTHPELGTKRLTPWAPLIGLTACAVGLIACVGMI